MLGNALSRNTIWISASNLIGQLALAVLFLIVARLRSPKEFGIAVVVYSIAVISTDVIDFGTTPRSIRERSSGHLMPDRAKVLAVTRGALACAGAVVWFFVSLGVGLNPASSAALALFVVSRTTELSVFGLLQAEGRFAFMSWCLVTDRVIALVVGMGLAWLGGGAAVCIVGGLACGAILSSSIALRGRISRPPLSLRSNLQPASYWRFGRHYAVSGIVTDLQVLDTAIVAAIGGAVAASYFAVGARLTGPFSVLAISFASVLVPPAALALARGTTLRPFIRAGALVVLISTVALTAIMVLAPTIVHFTFGDQYLASVPVVQIYAGAAIVVCASQPMARLLQTSGDQRSVGTIVTAGVSAGLVLIALGVHWSGAVGAAVGFLVSTLFMFALLSRRMIIVLRRRRTPSSPLGGCT